MSLRVGAATRDISPTKPAFLVGYPHVPRTSTGIHDPLLATALYLENDGQRLLLVALDIAFITAASTRACRAAIARATGIPPGNILISATHTHSGPVTFSWIAFRRDPVVSPPDPEYMKLFEGQIVAAGTAAAAAAVEARLAIASVRVDGVGTNRLSPDGPIDREVGLLFAKRCDNGQPLAVAMIYGMHPTVLHEDSKLVSSDFPHYARAEIQAAFPGLPVLYHTAPAGNLSPRYVVRGQTFAEAERLGRMLGRPVVAALQKLGASEFRDALPLGAGQELVRLVPREFPSVAQARAGLTRAVAEYERLKREGAPHGPVRTAECTVFGAEETVTLAEAAATGELARVVESYQPVEIQVLRVGDTCLVGIPGELFVEYALELKRRVPGRTFVISLANGELHGYIVTPEAEAAGGYEATNSSFRAASGQILVDAAVGLVEKLAR